MAKAFSYKNYNESKSVKKKRQEMEDNSTYNESSAVKLARDALNAHNANKVADWTGGNYGDAMNDALNKYTNREKFKYDLNGDALYQQYKDQYINQGRLAMQDTMGQASALTGGYGNSYASTVGNQAYQGYLQKLNDVVPELYQMALDQYNQEGENLLNNYNVLNNQYNTEYGEWRDKVSDWNTEASRLSDAYNNERNFDYSQFTSNRDYYANQYNNERTYDYGLYNDAYNRAFDNYKQQVSEDQFNQNLKWQKESAGYQKQIKDLKDIIAGYEDKEKEREDNNEDVVQLSSSEALNLAVKESKNLSDRILALKSMCEAGQITEKQRDDLIYALKHPEK